MNRSFRSIVDGVNSERALTFFDNRGLCSIAFLNVRKRGEWKSFNILTLHLIVVCLNFVIQS